MLWFEAMESWAKRVDLFVPSLLPCFLIPGILPPVDVTLNITSLEGLP